ncbi:MAG: hypothetical protein ACE5JL_15880, partial [Dehalococcoidia bacterium]
MRILLTAGLVVLLVGTACAGGLSDADKTATAVVPTATAQAQATATAQAEATSTAEAQAQATATAQAEATATAQPQFFDTVTPSPRVQHWLDVYDSLPDDVKARIGDIYGLSSGRNQFVEAMSWLDERDLDESKMRSLARIFEAVGGHEVT